MEKISIIVPTYNVEKYIRKCLDSLLKQDYENYDVIVVNDGSPANEQIIIDEYVHKYPKIIRSIVKENGGYGSVLELAFNSTNAEYVLICDPDDYLADNALSTLYKHISKTKSDIVVGAKNLVYSDNDEIKYDCSFNKEFGILQDGYSYAKESEEYEKLFFMEPSPHSKLYKRSLVSGIAFPKKVSYTDNLLYFFALSKANRVTYCKDAVSYYLIDREGNTRTDLKATIIDAWVTVFISIIQQVNNASDIFYYRMFESFYSIYYKVDNINASHDVKIEKYELIYTFLERLLPYKNRIITNEEKYDKERSKIKRQRLNLLSQRTSYSTYKRLYIARLNGSLKSRVKNKVVSGQFLGKIYNKYHDIAKYYYTRNDVKCTLMNDLKCNELLSDSTYFFGYYDKPCNEFGKNLLHRVNSNVLGLNQEIDIVVDGRVVSSTNAWNWQQGAMSTWFDGNHIIHNFYDGGSYRSKIVNIDDLTYRVIEFPIYSLSKDKKFSLSLNFSRLAKLRPDYGYFNKPCDALPSDDNDGIYYIELLSNSSKLLLSIETIKRFCPDETMQNAIHKVNHIDISPDSKKAIFLHRWFNNKVKYTRLVLLNLETNNLKILAGNSMVSHMCWYNNDTLFGYLNGDNGCDGYFFIDLEGKQTMVNNPLLKDDGHPTVYNSRYIVIDSYPDYKCKSKLMLVDIKSKEVIILGEFYSYKKYKGINRCDLHPRFNSNSAVLTFDSVFSGHRKTYEIKLDNLIEDKV